MAGEPDNVIRMAASEAREGDPGRAGIARNGPAAIGPAAKEARRLAILARRDRLAFRPSEDDPHGDPSYRPEADDADCVTAAAQHAPATVEIADAPPVPPFAAGLRGAALASPESRTARLSAAVFVGLVVLPVAVAAWYLWAVAVDQYASRLAFTVRHDSAAPAAGLMGGMAAITALSGRGGQEADVIAAFVTSPDLVARIDGALDLRVAFSLPHARDPVFALAPGASIEDLTRHWRRQVSLAYDPGTGLIDLTVRAFDPATAQEVARAILAESAALVDRLSRVARNEAMEHAGTDLARAEDRLSSARMAMARFRAENRLVDPAGEAAVQSGLVASLEAQLAEALIAQDMLAGTTRAGDPRVVQTARRIDVIEGRIAAERARFAPDSGGAGPSVAGAGGARDHASVMAEYERLAVDQAFAEAAYTAALAAVEAARADAARRALHLAPHVEPTLAERAEFPRRWIILGLVAGAAVLVWSVLVLAMAALRDRA